MGVKVKVAPSGLTLCDPMDYIVHRILQARILEWVTFSFFPRDLPNRGTEPKSPMLQADSLPAEPPRKPRRGWGVPENRDFRGSWGVDRGSMEGLRAGPRG